jgi:hypothetical protein
MLAEVVFLRRIFGIACAWLLLTATFAVAADLGRTPQALYVDIVRACGGAGKAASGDLDGIERVERSDGSENFRIGVNAYTHVSGGVDRGTGRAADLAVTLKLHTGAGENTVQAALRDFRTVASLLPGWFAADEGEKVAMWRLVNNSLDACGPDGEIVRTEAFARVAVDVRLYWKGNDLTYAVSARPIVGAD